ncbi:MAG TPA: glycosyltransferase family 2 protein [Bacteroidetes bacterium]|nr:glycosyltransferase family 2 protein [Bacteroidota bacterium]
MKSLKKNGYHDIVVVDDGSSDKTFDLCKREKVHALRHVINRGQGAALKTGIDYALLRGADIIVTFDADGQHRAEEIKRLTEPIEKGEADAVLGSRFLDSRTKVPFFKKIVLKGGVLFTRAFSGIKLTDTHNGFRALSRRAAQKIEIEQDRMAHASEIIDEIARKKIRFKEVPVTIVYTEYSKAKGQSILNSIRIAAKFLFHKLMR